MTIVGRALTKTVNQPEARAARGLAVAAVVGLEALVQLQGGLEQQEGAADHQDQVAPGKAETVPAE
jgi:hypothetical protein